MILYTGNLKDQHTILLKLLAQWNKNQKQIIHFFSFFSAIWKLWKQIYSSFIFRRQ